MSGLLPFKHTRAVSSDAILSEQVRASQRPGVNALVRVQGAAFVSTVAMSQAAALSKGADHAFRQSPMGEDTYRAILDAFGRVAVLEISDLALRQNGGF